MVLAWLRSIAATAAVGRLPERNQITFGGGP
jgi:hypothetical protein